jgi:hypothetical protein
MGTTQSPGELDARLEAVGHAVRRELLFDLRRAVRAGENAVDVTAFCAAADVDSPALKLAHTHLPKLAELGFVTLGPEGDRVEPGPRFDELLPLLDFLAARRTESTGDQDGPGRPD